MRTKIVATLGPASSNYETMKAMAENGVRIFRLNFSHSDAETFKPVIRMIRELETELGIPLTAMGDLCGPKIRIGEVDNSPVSVHRGQPVYLGLSDKRDKAEGLFIELDMPELLKGLDVGMPVSLSDGLLQFSVSKVLEEDAFFEMKADNAGILSSRKGIAFPGKFHPMPALTDKDRKDLAEGIEAGIDAVALSFVQTLDDIQDIKAEIAKQGTWIPVIAKIERQSAVDNLEGILELTDAVMVARGDLGLECPLHELPIIQKHIVRSCRHAQKACIVATQMLLSMVKNPIPTRAETTDVANAIIDGADCMMLSEETAMGEYPAEAVKYMSAIARQAEAYFQERLGEPYAPRKDERNAPKYLAYSACLLAENSMSEGLVCHTTSGSSARLLSSRRPDLPVYALTTDPSVVKYMNFFRAVHPMLTGTQIPEHLHRCEEFIRKSPLFKAGDTAVITAGEPCPGQTKAQTNTVKIYYK